jgi:hypothetical protein
MGFGRKSGNIWWILCGILLAFALIGGVVIYNRTEDPYRTFEKLDTNAYYENANGLRGNVYKIDGVIQNSLGWSPSEGRLFSVSVKADKEEALLPVLVPAEFNHFNLQKGQKMIFKVEIIKDGFIKVIDLRKP